MIKSRFAVTGIGFLLLALPIQAFAQDAPVLEAMVDGRSEHLGIVVGDAELNSQGPVWWQQSFSKLGTQYSRFLLRLAGNVPDDLIVKVTGPFQTQFEFSPQELTGDGAWTGMIPFGKATISVESDERPSGVRFEIVDSVYQAPGGYLYSVHGENEITEINDAKVPEHFRLLGKPVAKLVFQREGKPRSCTGFLLDDSALLTNEHCVNNQEICATLAVVFEFEIRSDDRLNFGQQFFCESVKEDQVNYELDAAIVKLKGRPGTVFGRVEFAERDAIVKGQDLFIIQHPGGEPKKISSEECAASLDPVSGRGDDTDFTHTCDTASGSSGSPVFNGDGAVVGLHHFGFEDHPNEGWSENRAVRLLRLYDWLSEIHFKAGTPN